MGTVSPIKNKNVIIFFLFCSLKKRLRNKAVLLSVLMLILRYTNSNLSKDCSNKLQGSNRLWKEQKLTNKASVFNLHSITEKGLEPYLQRG